MVELKDLIFNKIRKTGCVSFIIYSCFHALVFLDPPVSCLYADENIYASYLVSVETVVSEGMTTDSGLVMVPAANEYRIEGFTRTKSEGSASSASESALQDAVHDALSRLVVEKGLKSVKSSQELVNGRFYDVTKMRHEGIIKYPYTVKKGKTEKAGEIHVEIEVDFSPVSMPSEWGWQRFKKTVSNSFSDVVSVFRHIWD